MHIYLSLMHVSQAAEDVQLVIISTVSVLVTLIFAQVPTFEVKRGKKMSEGFGLPFSCSLMYREYIDIYFDTSIHTLMLSLD